MTLSIASFVAGPLGNNVILLTNLETHQALLIDPSFEPQEVVKKIVKEDLKLETILFTHGHFDHFTGLAYVLSKIIPSPKIGLHPGDLSLWRDAGGSKQFRMAIDAPADPDFLLEHQQKILLGDDEIEVRYTPGHSPGSVLFYIPSLNTAVVGDLIFRFGIGRTDLDGGSYKTLVNSIRTQVFTLPAKTILIPGHGPSTTVKEEMEENPYLDMDVDEEDY